MRRLPVVHLRLRQRGNPLLGGGACSPGVPEPETERVPWYSVVADQRRLVGFPKVGGTRYGADGCLAFTDHDGVLLANVHDPAIGWDGSGTVEVLKDGDQ